MTQTWVNDLLCTHQLNSGMCNWLKTICMEIITYKNPFKINVGNWVFVSPLNPGNFTILRMDLLSWKKKNLEGRIQDKENALISHGEWRNYFLITIAHLVEYLLCAHLCAKPSSALSQQMCHSLVYSKGESEARRVSIPCQRSHPGSELGWELHALYLDASLPVLIMCW